MSAQEHYNDESDLTVIELNQSSGVWPTLITAYQEQGYGIGYARAVSDTRVTILEATEDFLRKAGGGDAENRRLILAFAEYLQDRLRQSAPAGHDSHFIDGLGI